MSKNGAARLKLTRTDAAELVMLSPRQFDEAIRSRLPKSAASGAGAKLRYDAQIVVATLLEYRLEQARAESEDATLLSGEETPGLERMRNARADILEMDRDRLRARLVPIDELKVPLAQLAALIRDAGNKLARRFGNDAPEILSQAVNEAEAGWNKLIADAANNQPADGGAAEGNDPADPPKEASHDAPVRRRRARASNRSV